MDEQERVPQTEPDRQNYFMQQCKERLNAKTKRSGHPPIYCVHTFGCQMNARDSEKLSGILEQIGCRKGADEEADILLYNTCTVRENADNKVYGHLGQLAGTQKDHPGRIVCLCGCMMQEPDAVERIRKTYPFVSLIFGTHNLYQFAELLDSVLREQIRAEEEKRKPAAVVSVWQNGEEIVEDLPSRRKYSFKSGVNISFGCDNFCTYCVVPYVRGRERSRRPLDVLREVERLAADGVCEVMLLGQNVNSYGKDLKGPMSFAQLLRQVNEVEGIKRIRFMTSHPKDLSDELIEAMRDCGKVCRHLHLPLQAGSDRILSRMNRHYTKEQYLLLVEKIRKAIPDIALTTDIMVGFPGETEEDFLETMDVVERVRYDSAFTFIYSKRSGTPAAQMPDQVPEDVVKDRFSRLLRRVQQIGAEQAKKWEGEVLPVLAEEQNARDPSLLTGRLSNNSVVHFAADPSRIGTICSVRLEECRGFYYLGAMADT